MKLHNEILFRLLETRTFEITFPGVDVNKLMEQICYQTLERIKGILEDDTLEDPECFERIERIVEEFEAIGSTGGSRHDFG